MGELWVILIFKKFAKKDTTMIDFIEYVVTELKHKRLSKTNALSLIKQYSKASRFKGTVALHPLLHRNTSDLEHQSYSSTFYGDEFFLKDHQIHGQKTLPGVAYLEMVRAAVDKAVAPYDGAKAMEFNNVVWTYPIVVSQATEVTVILYVDTDQSGLQFEIYSGQESEMLHCQGQIRLLEKSSSIKLDLDLIKEEVQEGTLESNSIYAAYAKLGINYGPSHRGIKTIYQGEGELLAQLELPEGAEQGWDNFVLHPSILDSAVQSAIGFLEDISQTLESPQLPYALESIKIFSHCAKKMFAHISYPQGYGFNDPISKLDIDLCDEHGNICVRIKGFTSREFKTSLAEENGSQAKQEVILAAPHWTQKEVEPLQRKESQYDQHYILLCDISKSDKESLQNLIPGSRCLSFQSNDENNIAQVYTEFAKNCFKSIRNILREGPEKEVLVQIVIAADKTASLLSGLSGLLQTARQENPWLKGQIIQLDPKIKINRLSEILNSNSIHFQDTVVRYQKGVRSSLGWQLISKEDSSASVGFKEAGVYVITGGLGKLGRLFAREILQQTASCHIILTGRLDAKELKEKASALSELQAIRNDVVYCQLDLENLADVKQFTRDKVREFGQINGILHSAGMIADNYIVKKSKTEFNKVLQPKVTGTYNLDKATKGVPLDFFVMFSSVASSFGNLGQSDYAVANGFMNRFAQYRNDLVLAKKRYGKTLSIHWPLWLEGGMAPKGDAQQYLERETGMHPMRTINGMKAFYQGLNAPYQELLVMEGNKAQLEALLNKPIKEASVQGINAIVSDPAKGADSLDSMKEKTRDFLRKEFSQVLKLPEHRIDPQQPLEKYGIDSILALSLTTQLEKTFNVLPKTLFFEYQTIDELAAYFKKSYSPTLSSLFGKPQATQSPIHPIETPAKATPVSNPLRRFGSLRQDETTANEQYSSEPIAIVGLSGRYPEAVDIEGFWRNLRDGKDSITEVPKERWDLLEYYTEDREKNGYHFSKWGGFISGADEFDPRFFNISPREAVFMDPQERLFLQHAWMAVEDAGYDLKSLRGSDKDPLKGQVGVYAGVMYSEYQFFGLQRSPAEVRMSIPGSYASIANRVSYTMNLHGPSMTIDTMCSSSLSAIHLACQDLKLGKTKFALVGGVNLSIHPNKYLFLSSRQFISTAGHCHSFGVGGDGYIPGEGVGVVLLKRLSEAQKDGDHIYGVIKGSSLNHGGKTNGYSVPNPKAQAAVIGKVLEESKIDPRHISYIEAHGTGTKLGDPIEIAALSNAFGQHTQDTEFCLIGSAKSNIGHCESAAGIAGLTKVLLQMKHKKIVPSLHSAVLNPYIDFHKTPFVVNQTLKTWDPPVIDGKQLARIAGISAFGAGGSNAHMIVQEYNPPLDTDRSLIHLESDQQYILPLSARNSEQLKEKAMALLSFTTSSKPELVNMAYTLQVGREAMDQRIGFIVKSHEELILKLQEYIEGKSEINNVFQGKQEQNKALLSLMNSDEDFELTLDKWIGGKKLAKIMELWVNGLTFDWNRLYGNLKPHRISMPTYPFAKERYWIDSSSVPNDRRSEKTSQIIHPLLHSNTSGFKQFSFRSIFKEDELFIQHNQIDMGEAARYKTLPQAAMLEMAQKALMEVSQDGDNLKLPELKNISWGYPAIIEGDTEINIALFPNEHDVVDFEIYSTEDEKETVHSLGQAVYRRPTALTKLDIAQLKMQMNQDEIPTDALYRMFSDMGLHYGESYRSIVKLYPGEQQLLAQLIIPPNMEATYKDYVLHPSILDGLVQAGLCMMVDLKDSPENLTLPVALDQLSMFSKCTKQVYAWVRYASIDKDHNSETTAVDIDLCDVDGNICLSLKGLSFQEIALEASAKKGSLISSPNQGITSDHSVELPAVASIAKPHAITLRQVEEVDSTFSNPQAFKPIALELNNKEQPIDTQDSDVVQIQSRVKTIVKESGSTNQNGVVLDQVKPLSIANQDTLKAGDKVQLNEYLRTSLAKALYLDPSEIDLDSSFVDLGLDSILGVEWIKEINKKLGLEISATRVYDYSTVKTLGEFLYMELESAQLEESLMK